MSRGICHFAGLCAKADSLRHAPPLNGLLGRCDFALQGIEIAIGFDLRLKRDRRTPL